MNLYWAIYEGLGVLAKSNKQKNISNSLIK